MDDLLSLFIIQIWCNSKHAVAIVLVRYLLLGVTLAEVTGSTGSAGCTHEVVELGVEVLISSVLLLVVDHEVHGLVRLAEVDLLLLLLHLFHVLSVGCILRTAMGRSGSDSGFWAS